MSEYDSEFVASSVQVNESAPRERQAPMSSDWAVPTIADVRKAELRRLGEAEDFAQRVDDAVTAARRAAAGVGTAPAPTLDELKRLLSAAVAANPASDLD